MAIVMPTVVDDNGTGTTGTILDLAKWTALGAAIDTAIAFPFTWIPVTFAAGNFTGSGAQTWTLAAGDQTTFEYVKIGKTMIVRFCLETTTVGGTPSTGLNIAIPGGFIATEQTATAIAVINNGTGSAGLAQVNAAGTVIRCLLETQGNWAASTNLTSVLGEILFETTT